MHKPPGRFVCDIFLRPSVPLEEIEDYKQAVERGWKQNTLTAADLVSGFKFLHFPQMQPAHDCMIDDPPWTSQ